MDIQQLAEKLQQDGINKGKEEAEKVVSQANTDAENIVSAAKEKEKEIVEQAKKEAESILENGKQNLRLAARDVLLKLQQDISGVFQGILSSAVEEGISKEDNMKALLQSLVDSYKKQDESHLFKVEIPEDASTSLKGWLKDDLKANVKEKKQLKGFCLQDKDGGLVEVTLESVKEALLPFLSGLVAELMAQEKPS